MNLNNMEAAMGFEPMNGGFANHCLCPLGYAAHIFQHWHRNDNNRFRACISPMRILYCSLDTQRSQTEAISGNGLGSGRSEAVAFMLPRLPPG